MIFKLEEEKYVEASKKPKIISIDNYFMSEQEAVNSGSQQTIVNFKNKDFKWKLIFISFKFESK